MCVSTTFVMVTALNLFICLPDEYNMYSVWPFTISYSFLNTCQVLYVWINYNVLYMNSKQQFMLLPVDF